MRFYTAILLATLGGLSSTADAKRFLGWSTARGGESSLASSANYSATRAMINTNFPGSTIASTDTITPAALQNIDIVWLGTTTSFNSAITPLTSNERSALLAFILGGGTLVLFADNSTFSAGAPAANSSLVSYLGVAVTGTINGTVGHTVLSPAALPFTGPFGPVAGLQSGYPGWFAFVPATAEALSTEGTGGNALIMTFPPDGLGVGSGRGWLFSDSGQQGTGGTQGTIWNTLFANMISASTARVAGSITLSNMAGMAVPRPISITLRQGTTTISSTTAIMTAITDNFSLRVPMGMNGPATLTLDGSPYLRRQVPVSLNGGGLATGAIVMANGDVNDSGEVDAVDIDAVIADFGDIWPNGAGNPSADVNNSGEVDATDIDIVISMFGAIDE